MAHHCHHRATLYYYYLLLTTTAVPFVVVGQPVGCPGNVKADSDWIGHNIPHKELITKDAKACCEACASHTGCKFWTRSTSSSQPPRGRCYLKDSSTASRAAPGFEAGMMGSGPAPPPAPAPPPPPGPGVPAGFVGIGVAPLACAPARAMQQWVMDGSGRIMSRANLSLCISAGTNTGPARAGSLLYTEPCVNGVLLPKQNFSLQPTQWPASPGQLLKGGADGSCVAVRGCCDGGPMELMPCSKCDPSDTSIRPPPDCLMDWNGTTGTLRTVASGLCLDAGMALPQRACSTPTTAVLPFCDAKLTPIQRATDLVARLSLVEKTGGVLSNYMSATSTSDGSNIDHNLRQTAGVMRLGIPPMLYNEAMHGIAALCLVNNGSCPTEFPNQITQTASFNRTLWKAVASALGHEGRALANAGLDANNYWAPDVNPYRDPRYGRGQETGGEDAWLNEQVAIEYVLGLQGGPATGDSMLLATAACKHILIYDSQQPSTRDVNASLHDLHDYYLRPWRACATVAHSASMMCSYGSFNGLPDCLHGDYITDLIRHKWNWSGFVVSDCDAIDNHHTESTNLTEAAARGLIAGVDLDCGPYYMNHLPAAVQQGLVSEAVVDAAALRVLVHQFKLGVFDPQETSTNPYDSITLEELGSAAHATLAREAAIQSMTLLKNDGGLLPLKRVGLKLAFVGPHANSSTDLEGNDYPPGNTAIHKQTPLVSARRHGLSVQYAPGCANLGCASTVGFAAAVAAAKAADVAVIFLGISSAFENEGHDRTSLELPGNQIALAQACVAVNPKTVIVLAHGGMVHIDELVLPGGNGSAPSVLSMFYPGQEAGDALMAVLVGERSPAGRLPYTWYSRGFAQSRGLIFDNDLRSGTGITYRYWSGAPPLFEYGYGLSFTNFSYRWAEAPAHSISAAALAASNLTLQIEVSNIGATDSDAVVLVFVKVKLNSVEAQRGCPLKSLVGFERVHAAAWASATVVIEASPREIACVDEKGTIVLHPGTVTIEAGDVAMPASATTIITGAAVELPE